MRKKQDIVYEKDLGLDFGFPDMEEAVEEETEVSQGGVPAPAATVELDETTGPPIFAPDREIAEPPDWNRYRKDDLPETMDRPVDDAPAAQEFAPVPHPRLEELESKVARLEDKMDRIVSLLERISVIYGKNVSS